MSRTNPGVIAVMYGSDPFEMVPRLMDHFDVAAELPRAAPIGIKPNLVVSKPSSSGATTDPQIVESVVRYLRAKGFDDLLILESAWVGDDTDRAFKVCGYRELAHRCGVPLVNLERDGSTVCSAHGMEIRVCNRALDLGYLINIPVLKAHCQTKFTCALKNLKGLIPHAEKQRFHAIGLSRPIAILASIVRPNFTIVDGIIGDLSFEEGGAPVRMNRLFAGRDPVRIDAYGATLLGYEPGEISYIPIAEELGVGSAVLRESDVEALNKPKVSRIDLPDRGEAERLLRHIRQEQACSACVSSLLHALKRVHEVGSLRRLPLPVNIGQGFKKRGAPGLGVGSCTSRCARYVNGCPPSARDIKDFLLSCME